MKFKKGTKVIDVPIFHCKFAILDTKKRYNYLIKQGIEEDVPAWGESFGCVFTIRGENGCDLHVLQIDEKSAGCIAHEALHLVVNIMNKKDIPINEDTEEVQAYLLGWIVDTINDYLNK